MKASLATLAILPEFDLLLQLKGLNFTWELREVTFLNSSCLEHFSEFELGVLIVNFEWLLLKHHFFQEHSFHSAFQW